MQAQICPKKRTLAQRQQEDIMEMMTLTGQQQQQYYSSSNNQGRAHQQQKLNVVDDFNGPTIPLEMLQATAVQTNIPTATDKEAFSIKMVSSDKQARKLAKELNMQFMFALWREPEIKIGRMMFKGFSLDLVALISKDHCVIRGKREVQVQQIQKKKKGKNMKANPQNDDSNGDIMIGPTLNMQELSLYDKKRGGNKSNSRERIKNGKLKISSNSSSNHGSKNNQTGNDKKKSNPSIKVNGKKVLDSDLEEKKLKSNQQLLNVKNAKNSENYSQQQYLEVKGNSRMNISKGSLNKIKKQNRMKLDDSDEIFSDNENDNSSGNCLNTNNHNSNNSQKALNSFNSSCEDIFYTCPQIDDSAFDSNKGGSNKKPDNNNNDDDEFGLNTKVDTLSQQDESDYENIEIETVVVTFEIEDLSTNGTYLNGEKLGKGVKKPIKDGDEIGIVVMFNEQDKQDMRLGYRFRNAL